LWFADGDPVAIHTLLAAAHEVLYVLHKHQGHADLLFNSDLIKDQYRKLWMRAVKAHANFFKHADQDPEGTIEFAPRLNEMFILFCLKALHDIAIPLGFEEQTFSRWIRANRPELLKEGANAGIPEAYIEEAAAISKADFFAACQILSQR
jgi:hypothetical protein